MAQNKQTKKNKIYEKPLFKLAIVVALCYGINYSLSDLWIVPKFKKSIAHDFAPPVSVDTSSNKKFETAGELTKKIFFLIANPDSKQSSFRVDVESLFKNDQIRLAEAKANEALSLQEAKKNDVIVEKENQRINTFTGELVTNKLPPAPPKLIEPTYIAVKQIASTVVSNDNAIIALQNTINLHYIINENSALINNEVVSKGNILNITVTVKNKKGENIKVNPILSNIEDKNIVLKIKELNKQFKIFPKN